MNEFRVTLGNVELTRFLDLQIYRACNDHGHAKITAIIPSDISKRMEALADGLLCIVDVHTGQDKTLFCGSILGYEIKIDGDLHILSLTSITSSYYLDITPHLRAFQQESQTYESIIRVLVSSYPNSAYLYQTDNKNPQKLMVQYHQTDWQFLKRIAGNLNTTLLPDFTSPTQNIHFAIDNLSNINFQNVAQLDSPIYNKKFQTTDWHKRTNGQVAMEETELVKIVVQTKDNYIPSTPVRFQGQNLFVERCISRLDGQEIIHEVTLGYPNSMKLYPVRDISLTGASLAATITAVERDQVRVTVNEDELHENGNTMWYPYSTIYSSPDGSGWYCMPEIGDSVRLYIPSIEADAYIISAVHQSGDSIGTARSTPDNKSLRTKYAKELLLTPTCLCMTNNNGLDITLDDEKGITISANKPINISSDAAISIASLEQDVAIAAKQSISVTQGAEKIALTDNIQLSGTKINLQ